ncbi:MAG: 30S ribosomal protein S18 [Holosporales bacterium]|nr:30S ribosomal protein S18 [Holosporales bacterium]
MSDEVKPKTEEVVENKANKPIDYKDVRYLSRFVSERGKIIPCRVNSQSAKRQREISQAIKRARILALMPFVSK